MFRRVASLAAASGLALLLAGCSLKFFDLDFARREAWRGEAERACFASRALMPNDLVQRVSRVDGKGTCGMDMPLKVSALLGGQVKVGPTATLGCPQAAAVERWLQQSVEPAALSRFGSPVVAIKQMSSYSCRSINSIPGKDLSEHAFGNALDVGGFVLADGREISVKSGWNGTPEEQAFLGEVQFGACRVFSTVLAPGSDRYHHDHMHLDLANRKSGRNYCRPAVEMPPPPAAAPGGWQMVAAPAPDLPPLPHYPDAPPPLAGFGPPGSLAATTGTLGVLPAVPRPPAAVPLGFAPE